MISPTEISAPNTPSSLYSTPHSMISDGPSSALTPITLPPTHAEHSDSLASSFASLELSPSSRQSTNSSLTQDSSKGSSPTTLSPPETRSPSPPASQTMGQKLQKEKKSQWRQLAGASVDEEILQRKLQQYAKSRNGHNEAPASPSIIPPTPIPVTAPIDPPYLLPYTQMAPCYLLPNGQVVFLNPLEWTQVADTSSAFGQLSLSPTQQAATLPTSPYQSSTYPPSTPQATSDPIGISPSTPGVPTHSNPGLGVASPLVEMPTYVQPISTWSYDCRPYLVPQVMEGYVPSTNGRRRVRPGFCLFIFHLPPETIDEELYHLFNQYGSVLSAKVIRDKSTQDSKGYGFVNMATEQQADFAIERLNGSRYKNKYLKVSYKKKKNYSGKSLR